MESKTVLSVLSSSLKPAIYQLEIASEKVKENTIANTAVNSAISLIKQVESMVAEQHNADVDEFNSLCDEAENIHKENERISLELASLKNSIDEINIEALKKENEAQKFITKFNIQKATLKDQLELVRYYKQMQPEKIKSNNAELKKTNAELRKSRDAYKLIANKNKKEFLEIEKKLYSNLSVNTSLSEENIDYKKTIKMINGEPTRRPFRSNNSDVDCFIYTYEYPLVFSVDDESVVFIDGINWHKEIKTSIGININVSVTDWLMPIYPKVKELENHIPDSIDDELHNQIMSRCELTHPDLVYRVNWAKDTYLEDIDGIDRKILDKLSDANMITVFSVMNFPKSQFLNYFKKKSQKSLRGVNQSHIDDLFSVITSESKKIMKSYKDDNISE